jgi:hypothetical protein
MVCHRTSESIEEAAMPMIASFYLLKSSLLVVNLK